jgi:hypothetical protein
VIVSFGQEDPGTSAIDWTGGGPMSEIVMVSIVLV